jgi:very-short-patch-repair endonuclease
MNYCKICDEDISSAEAKYSKEHYGKYLCRDCQKEQKPAQQLKKLSKKPLLKPKSTPEAERLYEELKKMGVNAQKEKYDGYKHIDLAIPSAKINIEVDGSQHNLHTKQALADLKRTYYSFLKGYITLRIPNSLVKDDETIKETAKYLKKIINQSKEQLQKEIEDEDESDWNFW